MVETPPTTITKEIVLAAYNAENGSNYTFAELGRQLAINELQKFRRKMLRAAIVEEVII
ncbi:MAG: hypothetical protein OIN86_13635 [Candidatus Methanoperedens sp.]|nr:hypothetical protein [Candidatus Methanoperedens sp.]CAG0950772.1 hypothetical protein METP1_00185 [Methanosarcinales archaeon]